jgi:HNH endonuclease
MDENQRQAIPPLVRQSALEEFERTGRRCALCGWTVRPEDDVHVDHILPVVRGGSDDIENLRVVHASCNMSKSWRTDEEHAERISRPATCRSCGLVRRRLVDFTRCDRCGQSVCFYCALTSSEYTGALCPRCNAIVAYGTAHAKQDAGGRPIVMARVIKDSGWRHGQWSRYGVVGCSRYLLEITCPYCQKAHCYDGGEYFREIPARAGYRKTICGTDNGTGYILEVPTPVTVDLTVADRCLVPDRPYRGQWI